MKTLDRHLDLIENLEGLAKEFAQILLENRDIVNFDEAKLISKRIRIHGNFHLGQILKQENDFIIWDFEGEPESAIRNRDK